MDPRHIYLRQRAPCLCARTVDETPRRGGALYPEYRRHLAEQPDGSLLLTLTVAEPQEVARWARQFGGTRAW